MEVVSKPCQDDSYTQFWFNKEKKENTGSQMGHTKKNTKKEIDKYTKSVCISQI